MPNGELQNKTVESLLLQGFFIEPLKGDRLKLVLSHLAGGILYLSKIGELQETLQIVKKSTPLFSSISESESFQNIVLVDGNYIAACEGLFILEGGVPKIIPTSKNGFIDVTIEENKMTASMSVYPALPGGKSMQIGDVLSCLQKKGIKTGVNKNAIISALATSSNRKQAVEGTLIANGKLSEKGENGKIDCTINWQVDSKPSVNKNGTLNFHEMHTVIAVSKNQKVGKIIPPRKGLRGFDVFNEPLEAESGDAADISTSDNVYVSPSDNSTIYSKIDGFLEFKNNIINIKDQHVVSGDIDFHTGNISGNGSLKISGNVLNGFTLNLRDDIEIGGNIGDSHVEAGKDIVVKGGFSGNQHGVLKSGGSISVKYIENQKVYAEDSLTFSRDVVNSNVFVSKSIKGNGGNTCIVGGYTIAGDCVEVATVGNDSGTQTTIELGYDYSIKEKIDSSRQKIGNIIEIIKQMDQQLINYSSMKRLNPEQVINLKTLAGERKNLLAEVDSLKQNIEEQKKKTLEPSTAYLKCTKRIYPGVTVIINGRKLEIKEAMHAKTFQLSKEGEITC